jgi:hypothetical protein
VNILFLLLALLAAQPRAVTGTVVDGTSHQPIFGAVIAAPNGKRLAVTDRAGRFRIRAAAVDAIAVSAPRSASRSLPLPSGQTPVDFGQIFLWHTARLTVRIPPVVAPGTHVRWLLGRAEPGAQALETVREGVSTDPVKPIVIDGIEPSHYLVVLSGPEPLQRYALPVSLEPGAEVDLPITIAPITVDVAVTAGAKPLRGAVVRFEHASLFWKTKLPCNADGNASAEIWQGGKFWLFTELAGVTIDGQMQDVVTSKGHATVSLQLPGHAIRGHVVDAKSGAALAGVNVALEIRSKGTRSTRSDEDGNFRFDAVQEGEHVLRSYKKGYRFNTPVRVKITPDDDELARTIELSPDGVAREARVTDSAGAPIAGATTFFGSGAAVEPLERTDDAGTVALPPGTGVLFVVPETGSFAYRRISASDESVAVPVPRAPGLLTVRSESTHHDPIPFVTFVFRVDGMMIPPAVVGRLATTQHMPFRTDADGRAQMTGLPSGRYDLWPVRTREEMSAIFAGAAAAPAATVMVSSQPQIVTLTFEPVRK